jgi:histidinol-phosphate aminotransferase
MVIKAHIKKLKPYVPPLEGRDPKKYVLLDFNERTVPVPQFLVDELKNWLDQGGLQKYPSYGELQANIAAYVGVKKEHCMFTNGSDQGIDLVIRCCCREGTEVIIPSPTFAMYEQAAESEGLIIRRPHFTREHGFPLKEVLGAVNEKTSLIVLSNPNNPTGTEIPRADIMEVVKKNPNVAVLVDECYFEFMDPSTTVVGEVAAHPNLFVCRTFSKTWGIPSLRLGYLISAEENINALTCVRGPYDINQISVVAVEKAMTNNQYVFDYVKELNERAKPAFEAYLNKKGIVFWPSSANFIFCYFKDPVGLEASLRERGILVRPKKDADNVLGLRVSIGTFEQMERLMKELDTLLPNSSL